MKVIPHLHFNGQCEEAFNLYARVLGGNANFFRYEGSPAAGMAPEGWANKVMHASVNFGSERIYGADVPPQYFRQPQGFAVCIETDDVAKAEAIFNALAEGASVKMPFAETFWAKRYGDLTDRFGTEWMINVPKPM